MGEKGTRGKKIGPRHPARTVIRQVCCLMQSSRRIIKMISRTIKGACKRPLSICRFQLVLPLALSNGLIPRQKAQRVTSTDCDTNLSKSQPVPGIGSPSGFLPMCIQLYCQLRDLVVSFPQEGRFPLCIERILFRSSYGFIFAGWLAAYVMSGYFFEASPRTDFCPHPS